MICHDMIAEGSADVHAVSIAKKLQLIRMISLLLHSYHLVYCLMMYSFPKAEEIISKAKDTTQQHSHSQITCSMENGV